MAIIIPHPDFPQREMLMSAQLITNKGQLKIAEVTAKATHEIMQETYLAGYEQCMKDFGLTSSSKMVKNDG